MLKKKRILPLLLMCLVSFKFYDVKAEELIIDNTKDDLQQQINEKAEDYLSNDGVDDLESLSREQSINYTGYIFYLNQASYGFNHGHAGISVGDTISVRQFSGTRI